MKNIFIVALASVLTIGAQAQFTKARLQASGLTCSMCNNAIYKSLKAVPFVASVESDIKNASFSIVFRENSDVDIDALKKAVEDAGFSVASFTLTGKFDHVAIADDKHVEIDGRHFHFLKVNDRVLNGEQTITVVDRDFLTAKNFKKYASATKKACVQTGKAAPCCEKDGVSENTRIYHVTI